MSKEEFLREYGEFPLNLIISSMTEEEIDELYHTINKEMEDEV